MKNRRGLIIGMWCVLITCFSATTAKADDVPAPGNVKLKIETKRITQAEAEQYVKSGEKVTLGVYLVLDQGW
ncbi:MAG: hypothetical protein K2O01_06070, partial [Bacteroidales bacterium]|nr:hypothetical protein [Bacteroidales bacterium]